MNKIHLLILDSLQWVYRILGVDYSQLRAIVEAKLTMDNRRQIIVTSRNTKERSNGFLITIFIYSILGIFVGVAMDFIPSFILSMVVFFTYIIVMVAMTLITDFSSVLLDTSDNTIILPRPVEGRTLLIARTTHILFYVTQLAIGLTLAPVVIVFMKYGFGLLAAFSLGIVLSVITAVVLTHAFYLLVMQFSSEEKLKNIINYFQIFMAVLLMGGYQILPRMMERMDVASFVFEAQWWSYMLPPVWMAGAMEMVHYGVFDTSHILLSTCAATLPLLGTFAVAKYLTPIFTQKLGVLAVDTQPKVISKGEKSSFIERVSIWITKTSVERGAFEMIYKILGRDRKIRLKVYPSFGYIVVFGLIFVMRGKEDLATTWANLPSTEYYLVLLYLTIMVIQTALFEIAFSDDFKASWIYFSAPIDQPGEILAGALKAIFVRLFFPAYIVVSLFLVAVWGTRVVDDIIFAVGNNYLMLLSLALLSRRHLPFSIAPNLRDQSGNLLRGILIMIVITLLGAGHYLLTGYPMILMGLIPVQVGLIYLMQSAYMKTSWQRITF